MPAINFSPRAYLASVWHDTVRALRDISRNRAALLTLIVLLFPWWSLIFVRQNTDWIQTLAQAVGAACVFWWMSRSGGLPAPQVKYPRAESLVAIALIGLWMLWRTAICAKALPFLPADFQCFKNWYVEIAPKMFEQVGIPIALMLVLGYRLRTQGFGWSWRAWWISLPAILAVLGFGLYNHWSDLPQYGQNALEFYFGAGLPEEVLFRVFLFTRLEAWWRNSTWALFGSSVFFGLTHLPINYLVFTSQNWQEAWLTALTFQMGYGAVFAFAYQRTRNVWPLAILHTLVDAL